MLARGGRRKEEKVPVVALQSLLLHLPPFRMLGTYIHILHVFQASGAEVPTVSHEGLGFLNH